jgi:hypothetical protein
LAAVTFLAVLLLSPASEAKRQTLLERNTSVRALGMGNAYTAVVANSDSLFYNPAGLSRVQGFNWLIFSWDLGANGLKVRDAYKTITDDEGELKDLLKKFYGEGYWFQTDFKSLVTLPGFGAGIYGGVGLDMLLENPAYTNLEIAAMLDYGLVTGLSFSVVPEFVDVGFSVKRFTRRGSSVTLDPSILGDDSTDDIIDEVDRTGTGVALDLGMNIKFPSPVKPTLSVVWKNVGRTSFRGKEVVPHPDDDEIILGAALEIEGPLFAIRPAIDYKYTNWTGIQLGKKLHMGVELDLPIIDARAGLHQGYYTLGVGANLGLLRIDAATYGVELGVYPGQLEDRRYIVQLSMEMGFNPSFTRSGGDSRTGGLKQRR